MSKGHVRARILGCGSSAGVPRIGGDWGACDPDNPLNLRTRCSLMVERKSADTSWDKAIADDAVTRVLIDTSPDLRAQMLAAGVGRVDAVVYSHDHADQSHGIDDLRILALRQRKRVPVHMDAYTASVLVPRFAYCFEQAEGNPYPAILQAHVDLEPGRTLTIEGAGGPLDMLALHQNHGTIDSLGFRFGPIAYNNDCVGLPDETLDALTGLETWIVDALRYDPHPSHAHVDLALSWADRIAAQHVVLTNLHIDLDYRALKSTTPDHVEPAHDGLVIAADTPV